VSRTSPLWDDRGRLLGLDYLPISDSLRLDLAAWASRSEEAVAIAFDSWVANMRPGDGSDSLTEGPYEFDPQVRADGLALFSRLKDELGPGYHVEWDGP
jgi:hypothetical protein